MDPTERASRGFMKEVALEFSQKGRMSYINLSRCPEASWREEWLQRRVCRADPRTGGMVDTTFPAVGVSLSLVVWAGVLMVSPPSQTAGPQSLSGLTLRVSGRVQVPKNRTV